MVPAESTYVDIVELLVGVVEFRDHKVLKCRRAGVDGDILNLLIFSQLTASVLLSAHIRLRTAVDMFTGIIGYSGGSFGEGL